MKKLFAFLLVLVVAGAARAQTAVATAPADPLTFRQMEFDFGKIPQGRPVYHTFEVVNTGSKPLQLDNVQASCGCTTPEWSKEPIAPGATAKIRVGFNAAAEGPFQKPITVQYNGTVTRQLLIKGQVWRTPATAAPAHPSITFLKQQIQ